MNPSAHTTNTGHRLMPAATLLAGLLAAGAALGDHQRAGDVRYARVIDVQPVYRYVEVPVPVRECREVMAYSQPYHGGPHAGGGRALLGGIIGGVVGNRFGGGHGREAMTAVGALIGASIGHDADHRAQAAYPRHASPVTECTTHTEYRQEHRLDYYRVRYEFDGRQYTTQTRTDPGATLPVRVKVTPAL